MDARHTPEPWGYSQDDWRGQTSEFDWYIRGDIHEDWGEDNDDDFPTVVSTAVAIAKGNATSGDIQHANARRIVSAVNSVAGISTEALEGGVIAEMREILCECLIDYGHPNFTDRRGMADDLRAVLSKLNQNQ